MPGLLLITVGSAVQGTAIMVATDMTGGIIDRFRTMSITRASVLIGHVLGSLIQALAAIAWSIAIAIAIVAYLWAIRLYNQRRANEPT